MPIFEYLCPSCNRIYSFLSLAAAPARQPVCPRCGSAALRRVPSTFAVSAPHKSSAGTPTASGPADDTAAAQSVEREAMRMASEMSEADAEDPRVMSRMMRRLAEASGERITPAMEEMFRRMEAGEDPEALDEELGDRLEEEMGGEEGDAEGAAPTRDDGLYNL